MKRMVSFFGKEVRVSYTKAAEKQIRDLEVLWLVEMELYFSCMTRKRVNFRLIDYTKGLEKLTDNMFIQFRTVMTKNCLVSDYDGPPPVTDFHITNPAPFVPAWVKLDFKKGKWAGEYGWDFE